MSECRKLSYLVGPYVDGALDPATTLDVETHLEACAPCKDQFDFCRAVKTSVKRTQKDAAPNDVRARLLASLESAKNETPDPEEAPNEPVREPNRFVQWIFPLAAAAAVLIGWKAGFIGTKNAGRPYNGSLGDILAEHSRPLPPETTAPDDMRRMERYVGVPVKLPMLAKSAKLVGGRVMPLQRERAAMLQYEIDQGSGPKRISVFVYDPRKIQVDDSNLATRGVGSSEVRLGRANGYSVAVAEHDGIGYAVASDLDPEGAADLIVNTQYQ